MWLGGFLPRGGEKIALTTLFLMMERRTQKKKNEKSYKLWIREHEKHVTGDPLPTSSLPTCVQRSSAGLLPSLMSHGVTFMVILETTTMKELIAWPNLVLAVDGFVLHATRLPTLISFGDTSLQGSELNVTFEGIIGAWEPHFRPALVPAILAPFFRALPEPPGRPSASLLGAKMALKWYQRVPKWIWQA